MRSFKSGPETKRLEHRAFSIKDAEAFFALNSNPDVMRYTGEPLIASIDAAKQAILDYPDFEAIGYGRWACVLKETKTVIGFCGLKCLPNLEVVDVGYRFLPQYWGRGLATEACFASLNFGFTTLALDRIVAFVVPDNAASIRVLEKVGMQLDGEFVYDGTPALRFSKLRPIPANNAVNGSRR